MSAQTNDDTVSVDSETEETQTLDTVTVTGIRGSLADAIGVKRNANLISDGISAQGIADFPDLNLSEALQRVTGIQINRQNRARTGSVLVRGLPETFSLTTFNGQTLQPPQFDNNERQGTGFPLGILRSEVIGSINVLKSPTAELNVGGLSGTIDLRTRRPLETEESFAVSLDGRYEAASEAWSPGGAVAFSKELVDDTLGVSFALGFQGLDYRRDAVSVNSWIEVPELPGSLVPAQVRQSVSTFDGDQVSASGELQWQPTPQLDLSLSGLYGYQNLFNTEEFFRIGRRPHSVISALSTPTSEGTIRSVRIQDPRYWNDTRYFDETWETYAIGGRAEWSSDELVVDGGFNYTEGRQDRPNASIGLFAGSGAPNGFTFDILTGDGDHEGFAVNLVSPTVSDLRTYISDGIAGGFTLNAGADPRVGTAINNPLINLLAFDRDQEQNSSELSFDANVEYFTENVPFVTSIKTGIKIRDIEAEQDSVEPNFGGLDLGALDASILTGARYDGDAFFAGDLAGASSDLQFSIDVNRLVELGGPIDPATLRTGDFVGYAGIARGFRVGQSFRHIYNVERNINAVYGMVNFGGEISPTIDYSGNIGGRYVTIDRTSTGFELISGQPAQSVESQNAFDRFLPSGNVSFNIGDDFVIRAAASETVVPPNPIDFVSNLIVDSSVLNEPDPSIVTDPTITLNLGARDLDPFTAVNYDLAFEWYNRPGSIVSLSLFQKDVAAEPTTVEACPLDGGNTGLGALQVLTTGPDIGCFLATTPAGFTQPVRVDGTATDTLSYTLQGLEFSLVQNLDFLPAPFDGFGTQFNYTLVDVVDGLDELPQISKDTVNVILFYETDKYAVRGAYNYRSDYFLQSNSTIFGLANRVVDSRGQFDLSASYNVNDRLALQFEAFNITDEPLVETEGADERLRRAESYGRAYTVSARYKF